MANKKLLYLEDLYDFYSSKYKRSTHFSSIEHGSPIVVQAYGTIKFDSESKDTEGLCPVHLQACHTGLNINQTNIDDSVMEANLNSFKNRPILGYIHKVITDDNPDGQWEFYSHNMHEDENGDIVYDEVPIGLIPESCNAQIVYDEEKKKNYVEVDGYLFSEYSKAVEILEREQECSVSVELSIRELSYNAKDKYLDIEDFFFSGVTILGKTPSGQCVRPGMEGSNIKLADFSEKNNSLFVNYTEQINILQQKVDALLSCFDIENKILKEGGNISEMNKFEELLQQYNKTVEDINFEHEAMSDEDLEKKFKELFAEEESEESTDNSVNSDDNTTSDDTNNENSDGENPSNDGTDGSDNVNNEQFEKLVRTYEISHEDIRYALYSLLAPFEDSNNEWYWISAVYDNYFVYENWEGTKIYRQDYTKDDTNVEFSGERIELFKEYVTASEKAELDAMRANYASLVEFKENAEKNELHEKREKILANKKYDVVRETDSFKELVKKMDSYSLEDLDKEAKIIFADAFDIQTFSAKNNAEKDLTVKIFRDVNNEVTEDRYGDLFCK